MTDLMHKAEIQQLVRDAYSALDSPGGPGAAYYTADQLASVVTDAACRDRQRAPADRKLDVAVVGLDRDLDLGSRRETHAGLERDAGHRKLPVRAFFQEALGVVLVGFHGEPLARAQRQEGEHVARRERRHERLLRIDALRIALEHRRAGAGQRQRAVLEPDLMRAVVGVVGEVGRRARPDDGGVMGGH